MHQTIHARQATQAALGLKGWPQHSSCSAHLVHGCLHCCCCCVAVQAAAAAAGHQHLPDKQLALPSNRDADQINLAKGTCAGVCSTQHRTTLIRTLVASLAVAVRNLLLICKVQGFLHVCGGQSRGIQQQQAGRRTCAQGAHWHNTVGCSTLNMCLQLTKQSQQGGLRCCCTRFLTCALLSLAGVSAATLPTLSSRDTKGSSSTKSHGGMLFAISSACAARVGAAVLHERTTPATCCEYGWVHAAKPNQLVVMQISRYSCTDTYIDSLFN